MKNCGKSKWRLWTLFKYTTKTQLLWNLKMRIKIS